MGYRSTVVITIEKELFENKGHVIKEYLEDADYASIKDGHYYFKWDSVKWYNDYPDIKAIEGFMKDHYEDDLVSFLRIGEDDTDVETKGSPYEREVMFIRDIEFPEGTPVDLVKVFEPLSVKLMEQLEKE